MLRKYEATLRGLSSETNPSLILEDKRSLAALSDALMMVSGVPVAGEVTDDDVKKALEDLGKGG